MYYHPRSRRGSVYSRVCLCVVCLSVMFWKPRPRKFTSGICTSIARTSWESSGQVHSLYVKVSGTKRLSVHPTRVWSAFDWKTILLSSSSDRTDIHQQMKKKDKYIEIHDTQLRADIHHTLRQIAPPPEPIYISQRQTTTCVLSSTAASKRLDMSAA